MDFHENTSTQHQFIKFFSDFLLSYNPEARYFDKISFLLWCNIDLAYSAKMPFGTHSLLLGRAALKFLWLEPLYVSQRQDRFQIAALGIAPVSL